jgi:hypothetical protein
MESIPENIKELLKLLQDAAVRGGDSGVRFKLDNDQMARLAFKREEHGDYSAAHVSLDVPRMEQAIIAALAALRGTHVEEHLRRVYLALPAARWHRQAVEAMGKDEPLPEEPPGMERAVPDDAFGGLGYEYAEDLLRHYRPDFDDMPNTDQAALVSGVLRKANRFLNALRELALYVQHGRPYEGLPNTPIREAARDMRAAELRDIEKHSYAEIGKQIGVKQTPSDESKGDNTRVRTKIVPHGRLLFEKALGKEGYEEHKTSSKSERARRLSLDEDSRYIEDFAEISKIPVETMRRIMTATYDELAAWQQTLDSEHPDDQRIFLAIMFGRAWRDFFSSR